MARRYPSINLIGYRVSLKKVEAEKQKKITRLSIYILTGFLVVFVPVLAMRFVFSAQRQKLNDDIEVLTDEITALKSVEAKYALLNAKSAALLALSKDRIVLEPKIMEVYEVMPVGTIIDDVSFGDGGKFLNVTVKAQDVFAVGDLMESIDAAVGEKFSSVKIDSTRRDGLGVYKVVMELYFESTS